jgi:hypothetical protein
MKVMFLLDKDVVFWLLVAMHQAKNRKGRIDI